MKYNTHEIHLESLNIESLYFVGDIHGTFKTFKGKLKQYDIKDAIVILCGDIGMGFYKPNYYVTEIGHLHEELIERNVHVIALRGNHDDPKYFTYHLKEIAPELYQQYPNWVFVEDYDLLLTDFGNILCIGGGVSVDRTNRQLNLSYWEGENVKPFTKRAFDRLCNFNIDIVASHNAPNITLPFTVGPVVTDWLRNDKYVVMDCIDERDLLQDIYETLRNHWRPSYWFYGHFHESFNYETDGVRFNGLNCNEFKEFR